MVKKKASTNTDSVVDAAVERYFPYLLEIRKRVFFLLAVFIASSILGFAFYERIVTLFLGVFLLEGVNIVFTSPFQFFNLAVSCGLLTGLFITLPLIFYQLLSFLKPALKKDEYDLIVKLTPISFVLFIIGFSFGVVIMKYVITLFYQRSTSLNVGNILDITSLLTQILSTSALMGLAFQFPIVISLLIRLNIVAYHQLASRRLLAYSISLIFAALLPPEDLISLGLLTLPLVILFELTLLFNRKYRKQRVKKSSKPSKSQTKKVNKSKK